jgi:hypothetical protein
MRRVHAAKAIAPAGTCQAAPAAPSSDADWLFARMFGE